MVAERKQSAPVDWPCLSNARWREYRLSERFEYLAAHEHLQAAYFADHPRDLLPFLQREPARLMLPAGRGRGRACQTNTPPVLYLPAHARQLTQMPLKRGLCGPAGVVMLNRGRVIYLADELTGTA